MEHRVARLEAQLKRLRWYAAAMTIGLAAVAAATFRHVQRPRYAELDLERLNIVESDGRLRLAIANSARFPPAMFHGKEYPGLRGGVAPGIAGMVYFNDEGTENGGFGWSGRRLPDGSIRAVGMLTFDQYSQNEALALSYIDVEGQRRAGLTVYDQPDVSMQPVAESLQVIGSLPDSAERARRRAALTEGMRKRGEVSALRMYAGKDGEAAVLVLADPRGRPRLRLSVDSLGVARLEFLDEQGGVVSRLPNPGR